MLIASRLRSLKFVFMHRIIQVGFINGSDNVAKAYPAQFKEAASLACQTKLEDSKSVFPGVGESDLPYLCLDLVYQYSLLVDGFGKFHFSC